jgi:hypothetical protein
MRSTRSTYRSVRLARPPADEWGKCDRRQALRSVDRMDVAPRRSGAQDEQVMALGLATPPADRRFLPALRSRRGTRSSTGWRPGQRVSDRCPSCETGGSIAGRSRRPWPALPGYASRSATRGAAASRPRSHVVRGWCGDRVGAVGRWCPPAHGQRRVRLRADPVHCVSHGTARQAGTRAALPFGGGRASRNDLRTMLL